MSNQIKNTKGAIVKEINGIKYFKLQSPYPGDYTKNCGLLSNEIDENFFFLRSYDIDSIKLDEERNLILTRVDGEELNVNIAQEIPYPTFTLNKEEGKIIITYPDGTVQELDGFLFDGYFDDIKVATDYTIKGNGTKARPLSISELEKTGTYAPAKFLVDLTDSGNTMPDGHKLGKGTRIVTKEYFTPFGLLYNYNGIKKIEEELEETHSKWRVPSKKDWADLLNAAEYCEEDRNHDTCEINKWTGNWAGARAKSVTCWDDSSKTEGGLPVAGIDNLPIGGRGKFHVIPVGYGEGSRGSLDYDEDFDLEGIRRISSFWSSTPTGSVCKSENPNVFTRTFSFDTRKVIQESSKPNSKLSLRLCRDYDYDSFDEYETILGSNVPCVLISNPDLKYYQVWTSINVGFSAPQYSGVSSEEWADLVSEEEIEIKEVYYVNEWNGIKWVKKQMNPGDSIVIIDYDGDPTTSGDTYHEWRVYEHEDGTSELIDTVEALKEEFEKEFDEINEKIDTLSASTEVIKDNLNTLSASTEVIKENLNTLSASTKVIKENLEKEVRRATSAETFLQEEIDSVEVREVEPSSGVFKSYAVYVNDIPRGVTIDIPKDSSFYDVYLGHVDDRLESPTSPVVISGTGDTALCFIFHKSDNTYELVAVNIEEFIEENEFKDGLEVTNHEVRVKIDEQSDPYLSVSLNGVKLSGVTEAINNLHEELDRTQEGAGLSGDGSYIQNTGATYISGETSLNNADIKLDIELAKEALERKGIHLVKVTTGLDANVREAYDLVDKDGNTMEHSERILIYKDSSLINVYLGHVDDRLDDTLPVPSVIPGTGDTALCFIYQRADGTYVLVPINVQDFLQESEFKDGLDVTNHEVRVKIADDSESFLTVSLGGVKLSGVQTAINEKVLEEKTRATSAETYISSAVTTLRTDASLSANTLDGKITNEETRATGKENELSTAISDEVSRATSAETYLYNSITANTQALTTAISNEVSRATSAEGELSNRISTNTQAIETERNRATSAETYISGAVTTLSNSTVSAISRIDSEIDTLSGRTVSGKEAIKVTVSADSTSIVSLQLNSNEQVLGQDNNGLKTNISLEYNKNDEKIYLKGKDSSNISEVSTSGFTGFKLSAVTPTETNVREAYQLINSEGVRCGDVVKIYKDSSLYNAYLGHIDDTIVSPTDPTVITGSSDTALCFIYQREDGTYVLVPVNVESFLQEGEFKDGLVVNPTTHEVRVKIADDSESFLTVSLNGVKLSGVTEAINNVATSATASATTLNNKIDNLSTSATESANTLNTKITALTARVEALEEALEEVIVSGITGTVYEKVKGMLLSTADEIDIHRNDTNKTITISFNDPYIIGKHDSETGDDF